MAKRFTDTEKWKRPWFSEMDYKGKLSWIYILDNCDNTGIWHANFSLMSFQLGFQVRKDCLLGWFGDKILFVESDKIFIESFIEFQYGTLNQSNNAHKPVIKMLEKLGAIKDLISPSLGAQDKDKDKDQDKDLDKDTDKEKMWKTSKTDLEAVYALYPRKEGKSRGMKIAAVQIKTPEDLQDLKKAILIYKEKANPAYFKHFDTFMNCWRDCLDPDWGTNLLEDKANAAKRDWAAIAEFVFQLGRRHGFRSDQAMIERLGPDIAELVAAAGGMFRFGQLPSNEHTTRTIAGMLKAADQTKELKK